MIGVWNESCKQYYIPLHLKYAESFGWTHNGHFYRCHDCMIGEEIKGFGYPYKFVTIFDLETDLYFLGLEKTVSFLTNSFLKLVLGDTYYFLKY